MAYGRISKKQQEILDYIKNEILNRGFPPAVREICEAVHLKSTSSVHSHLEALEKNGYIRRDATKPRAIEIIDDNFNLVRREVVNVPLVGTVAAGQPILAVENIETYFPVPAVVLIHQAAPLSVFQFLQMLRHPQVLSLLHLSNKGCLPPRPVLDSYFPFHGYRLPRTIRSVCRPHNR